MSGRPTPFLLDCDPGNDDALAILAAAGHPALALCAVTTGAGHLEAPRTAANAAIAVAAAGVRDVPVAAGAATPLVRPRLVAAVLDLSAGLDAERPELPTVPLDPRHSADVIAAMARQHPGLLIACTGPLTNLALALRRDPGIVAQIGRVITLGGAWGLGNKTAAAEWNILSDPEAAHIVYESGLPLTMIPIDAAADVGIDAALPNAAAVPGGPAARLARELLDSLRGTHRPGFLQPDDAPLNDPLAVLVAAAPILARTVAARVDIELAGAHTYGRTVVDFPGKSGRPPNCDVVIGFDAAATRATFLAALRRLRDLEA